MAAGKGDRGNGDDLPTTERRAGTRVPVEMWVEDVTDGLVYRRAGNLSSGGLRLDNTIPLPVGSTVHLRFSLPDDPAPIEVRGQIVSIRAGDSMGMGVKFTGLDPATAARIDAYVARLNTPVSGVGG